LITALCITSFSLGRRPPREAARADQTSTRIEDFAVEEGLLAAGRRGRDIARRHAERFRRVAPQILAVDLSDQTLGVVVRLELAPANVLGEEPEVMALERIGGLVAPVLHDVRAHLDDAAGAVVELALHAVGHVRHRHIDPLALGADGGNLFPVLGLVAPLLGFHHRHQQRLRRVRVLVDPGRAHAE
jgi:hypothetical protein